ncbi:hypothetical protein FSP39_012246 [Pinctada imbricata]|uniref:Uncharacterized protein n=1 Tax=Pinctada imbricata TaxID=66713 RepID=A0AA88YE93_PINIB|nr:hypothetical protein FSP39_012246 [Pinctada imbricata]
MPVYIRKNVNFTPPSIDKIPMEDEDDYITDPDQLKDKLPQPYRMIDKVLTQFLDDVWEIIEKRENKRLEESRKIRPPQYECAVQMKEGGTKLLVSKLEASVDGDYIGAVMENPETQDVWLEIHKLPRDAWLNEIDAVLTQIKKEAEKREQKSEPPKISSYEESETERKVPKFTAVSLVLKLKPPPSITGNQSSSIHSACSKIDSGEVIGSGVNHILTPSHLERRKDVFNHLHDNLIDYLPKTEAVMEPIPVVNFHFMNAGRLIPIGLEQPSQTDPENIKPDMVWPYTSIERGVVNVGEEGQTLIVWMKFLDPSICPQIFEDYQPYQTKTSAHLMVVCDDGSTFVMVSGPGKILLSPINVPTALDQNVRQGAWKEGDKENATHCFVKIETDSEMFSKIEVIPGVPDLMVTMLRSGCVQIRDIIAGKILCETVLPRMFELSTPWEPVAAVGGMGQMLYVRGIPKTSEDEDNEVAPGAGEESDGSGSLFVYQLRSFPTLDSYVNKHRDPVPYMVHTTLEKRVDALLKERIAQQGLRKTRMQERWSNLKEEIWSILQYKDQAEKRAENRPEVVSGLNISRPKCLDFIKFLSKYI